GPGPPRARQHLRAARWRRRQLERTPGGRPPMRMSLLIAQRELREIVRDHNLLIPLLMLPCLMGVLTGLTAMTSARGPASVGLTVTSAVLDQLPNSAQQRLAVQAQAADG